MLKNLRNSCVIYDLHGMICESLKKLNVIFKKMLTGKKNMFFINMKIVCFYILYKTELIYIIKLCLSLLFEMLAFYFVYLLTLFRKICAVFYLALIFCTHSNWHSLQSTAHTHWTPALPALLCHALLQPLLALINHLLMQLLFSLSLPTAVAAKKNS